MSDSTSPDPTVKEKTRAWATSTLGWLIVAAIVFVAIDWLFSTLALALRALVAAAVVGGLIYLWVKMKQGGRETPARP